MDALPNPGLDLQKIQNELQSKFRERPEFGSISVSAYFVSGRLTRIESGKSESMKAFSGNGGDR